LCGICVPTFDHHCIWLNQCVGEHNYKFFLLFLATNGIYLVYFAYIMALMLLSPVYEHNLLSATFVNSQTGQEFKASWLLVGRYVLNSHLVLFIVFMLSLAFGITLLLFLAYHLNLIRKGVTTNETFKWSSVQRIHRLLLRAHGRFLAAQKGEEYSEPLSLRERAYEFVARLLGYRPPPSNKASTSSNEGASGSASMSPNLSATTFVDGTGTNFQHVEAENDNRSVGCVPEVTSSSGQASETAEAGAGSGGGEHKSEGEIQGKTKGPRIAAELDGKMDIREFPGKLHPVRWVIEHSGVPDMITIHPGPLPFNPYKIGFFRSLYFIVFPKSTAALQELYNSQTCKKD